MDTFSDRPPVILLIDNYDSFAWNLARLLEESGEDVVVRRNDQVTADGVLRNPPSHVVISPGPCTPAEAGASTAVVGAAAGGIPVLGVCLGHQCIAAALGGTVIRAERPMHGRVSEVTHGRTGLFAGLPSPLSVTRYHSLVIDPADPGEDVVPTARAPSGEIMAVEHRTRPLWGVQFHPEAVLTFGGRRLLANFLAMGRGRNPDEITEPAAPSHELPPGYMPAAWRASAGGRSAEPGGL